MTTENDKPKSDFAPSPPDPEVAAWVKFVGFETTAGHDERYFQVMMELQQKYRNDADSFTKKFAAFRDELNFHEESSPRALASRQPRETNPIDGETQAYLALIPDQTHPLYAEAYESVVMRIGAKYGNIRTGGEDKLQTFQDTKVWSDATNDRVDERLRALNDALTWREHIREKAGYYENLQDAPTHGLVKAARPNYWLNRLLHGLERI